MRSIGFVVILFLATSCSSFPDDPYAVPLSHFGPDAATQDECIALGGTWGKLSTESSDSQCAVPTTDGGTTCTDHSQCQGLCVAAQDTEAGDRVTGQCRSSFNMTGRCDIRVVEGRAQTRLCID